MFFFTVFAPYSGMLIFRQQHQLIIYPGKLIWILLYIYFLTQTSTLKFGFYMQKIRLQLLSLAGISAQSQSEKHNLCIIFNWEQKSLKRSRILLNFEFMDITKYNYLKIPYFVKIKMCFNSRLQNYAFYLGVIKKNTKLSHWLYSALEVKMTYHIHNLWHTTNVSWNQRCGTCCCRVLNFTDPCKVLSIK
jgi:hypothetical protein